MASELVLQGLLIYLLELMNLRYYEQLADLFEEGWENELSFSFSDEKEMEFCQEYGSLLLNISYKREKELGQLLALVENRWLEGQGPFQVVQLIKRILKESFSNRGPYLCFNDGTLVFVAGIKECPMVQRLLQQQNPEFLAMSPLQKI